MQADVEQCHSGSAITVGREQREQGIVVDGLDEMVVEARFFPAAAVLLLATRSSCTTSRARRSSDPRSIDICRRWRPSWRAPVPRHIVAEVTPMKPLVLVLSTALFAAIGLALGVATRGPSRRPSCRSLRGPPGGSVSAGLP